MEAMTNNIPEVLLRFIVNLALFSVVEWGRLRVADNMRVISGKFLLGLNGHAWEWPHCCLYNRYSGRRLAGLMPERGHWSLFTVTELRRYISPGLRFPGCWGKSH